MKVLHIIIGLNVGGAELMLQRLIEHSNRSESAFSHAIISLTTLGEIGENLQSKGVSIHALEMNSLLSVWHVFFKLVKLVRVLKPDIVQTWMYHADLLGGIAAYIAGCKHIIWGIRTTDTSIGTARRTTWIRKVCAFLSGSIPFKIVCAAEASKHTHVNIGYRADRMVVIPNGFDLTRLNASNTEITTLRKVLGFSSNHVIIGCVGRFNADKDQYNFVRAAAILAQQSPQVRFLMVGRNCTKINADLINWITVTGFPERFVLLGERSDIPLCLAAMDIFCLSSRTEGFPNVVGEAMALYKPCVVTDVGDAAYLLGDCGVVVPKENSKALAKGMAKLLDLSSSERKIMGDRAHVRIATEFTMDRTRQRFEAIYTEVLQHRN